MKKKVESKKAFIEYDYPLEINALYKKYSGKSNYAVSDISFNCEKGKIIGLLGANGAGKSTTLKCVTGLIPLTKGDIKICGLDISKNPVDAKSHFSFVTDNHSVFTKMTGIQYLSFMADVYRVPTKDRQARVDKLESVFKLGDAVKDLIANYSHGMKQKICMMGSLMHMPELWILDEPMVGLDPVAQLSVTTFMREYVSDGKTILFSSHNLDVVRRICDRVIIISNGKLLKDIEIDDETRNNPEILQSYYINPIGEN